MSAFWPEPCMSCTQGKQKVKKDQESMLVTCSKGHQQRVCQICWNKQIIVKKLKKSSGNAPRHVSVKTCKRDVMAQRNPCNIKDHGARGCKNQCRGHYIKAQIFKNGKCITTLYDLESRPELQKENAPYVDKAKEMFSEEELPDVLRHVKRELGRGNGSCWSGIKKMKDLKKLGPKMIPKVIEKLDERWESLNSYHKNQWIDSARKVETTPPPSKPKPNPLPKPNSTKRNTAAKKKTSSQKKAASLYSNGVPVDHVDELTMTKFTLPSSNISATDVVKKVVPPKRQVKPKLASAAEFPTLKPKPGLVKKVSPSMMIPSTRDSSPQQSSKSPLQSPRSPMIGPKSPGQKSSPQSLVMSPSPGPKLSCLESETSFNAYEKIPNPDYSNWRPATCPTTGDTYFYHCKSNETTWKEPSKWITVLKSDRMKLTTSDTSSLVPTRSPLIVVQDIVRKAPWLVKNSNLISELRRGIEELDQCKLDQERLCRQKDEEIKSLRVEISASLAEVDKLKKESKGTCYRLERENDELRQKLTIAYRETERRSEANRKRDYGRSLEPERIDDVVYRQDPLQIDRFERERSRRLWQSDRHAVSDLPKLRTDWALPQSWEGGKDLWGPPKSVKQDPVLEGFSRRRPIGEFSDSSMRDFFRPPPSQRTPLNGQRQSQCLSQRRLHHIGAIERPSACTTRLEAHCVDPILAPPDTDRRAF